MATNARVKIFNTGLDDITEIGFKSRSLLALQLRQHICLEMFLQKGVTVRVLLKFCKPTLTVLNVFLGHFVRRDWRWGWFLGYKDPHGNVMSG